jgi:hypothetical protein
MTDPDPFTDWLEESDHGDLDFWGVFTLLHLEAAFWAGEQTGFERATEYYRTGGSFK